MYSVNDVLTAAPNHRAPFQGVARLLAVSSDGTLAALMRLDTSALHAPFCLPTEDLASARRSGSVIRLDTFDPGLPPSLECLSDIKRKRVERIVELMKPLLHDAHLILDPELRSHEFARRAREEKVAERTIRRYFYQYYHR